MPKGFGEGSRKTWIQKGSIPVNKGKGIKYEIRICTICGKEFTNPMRSVKTCSKECRYKSCSLKKGRKNLGGDGVDRKEKRKAQRVVQRMIKQGVFKKGVCAVCGTTNVQAHHFKGYDRENWLDILWLCLKHHKEEHKRLRIERRKLL